MNLIACNNGPARSGPSARGSGLILFLLISVIGSLTAAQGALPTPVVDLRFTDATGGVVANTGSLEGTATITPADPYPLITNQVPTGPYTPANNTAALDMGAIAAGQGGRAVDLLTLYDPMGLGTLGSFSAFTLCGWLNPRDLTIGAGGNRIAFALESPNGNGIDLVHLANGALRLGINQWPDGSGGGGPSSSSGRLTAHAQLDNANWVFFAVTYDPVPDTGNVKYYFGKTDALATLDSSHNYRGGIANGGTVDYTGPLTVGNFGAIVSARTSTGPTSSRCFRGLMDELKIYGQVLTLAEVQSAQLNGAVPAVPVTITRQPASQTIFAGQAVTCSVEVNGSAPFTFVWQTNGVTVAGASEASLTLTGLTEANSGLTVKVLVSNPISSNVASDMATLTVLPENHHKVSVSFSLGGLVATNTGNLEGAGVFATADGYPASSSKVPAGAFAPTGNLGSVDFGLIVGTQGNRAIDFTNGFGNTLGPMDGFTVCGWLNASDLQTGGGGNRITFALTGAPGPGFDLVQLSDGSLQLGVNQWPDGSPARSGAGMITGDPEMGAANWVFFAVTYDGTVSFGNVNFYFGTPNQAAQLDFFPLDYDRGVIQQSGQLTLGNFGKVVSARTATGPTGSRCFRGLMDEINIFNQVLTLEEIQAVQKAPAYVPPQKDPVVITQHPQSQTVFAGSSVTFEVQFTGTPPYQIQWQKNGTDITGATNSSFTLAAPTLADSGVQYRAIVQNEVNQVTSDPGTLTVIEETGHKVSLSFAEGEGTTTANYGNLQGSGAFAQTDGFPVFSALVPSGAYAPSNNHHSIDFGLIAEGQGGRAVDFTNAFGNTLGSMSRFTACGWVNAADLQVGWGGNRLLFALASPAGPGFDLVHLSDGSLQLGVNQWPDGSPALSSAGRITADPSLGAANWVFFAVTYDGTQPVGNVSFYFGTADQAAQPDLVADYDRGLILQSGALTVGNFGAVVSARTELGPAGGSRCFRGLIDEVNVFNKLLTLEEIQAVQKAPAQAPVQSVPLQAAIQGNEIVLRWESPGNFQLQSRADLSQGSWANETTAPTVEGNQKTVRLPITGPSRFFRLESQ